MAARETARREEALSTSTLDPSNKGFKMMAKLGYQPGSALGKPQDSSAAAAIERDHRITEPLGLSMKEDRGGLGMDAEKKRKFREEVEQEAKRVKADEGDFRERVRIEREEKRAEGQFHGAQKVAERLDAEKEMKGNTNRADGSEHEDFRPGKDHKENTESSSRRSSPGDPSTPTGKSRNHTKLTSHINILYRGLVRSRDEQLRNLQTRRGLYDSLSSRDGLEGLPSYDDPTLDNDDKLALGRNANGEILEVEVEEEEEDKELEEFNALSPQERLFKVVMYLREEHNYCFWCKHRYETRDMEGCPGITEEDHD